ncbi:MULTISPECIES: MaoC family dehydratase [Burkholderia]|uniref:MaoC family dehydratase n=1 Tax=Burkholderia anthinoferrum TaxID=3090833 RepID=A0ABU5WGV2_9BURK|nr:MULTISPECIES: MaoC family dehydratase [Burkholderia]MEB2504024.1 MaoC family dehydratase [Burkholderia anthinoferrum]MEB2530797.1 MaoC family dehydratase [Burkholderia anthinoferrum]MEB2564584.1 MaoC family dehydratase [Burkholderia anthinoferrum]MEB2578225.1 MaoC family dehydratase [Burkholderia anthinoferrum]MCA8107292.1 MaoC family dehydratase [Burkholderia sp. AU36459]
MNDEGGYDLEDLMPGMNACFSKTLSEHDVLLFANATGDRNPVHLDEAYAQRTFFGGRIAHGMLSASVISAAIATHLPGPGSIYLSQDLQFRRPVKLGETVCATVTVKEILASRRRVVLETRCEVDGLVVVEGTAVVMPTNAAARRKAAATVQDQAV